MSEQESKSVNEAASSLRTKCRPDQVIYRQYEGEEDLPIVMQLVDNELSEPYSIFTYRFFVQNWPQLCWLALDGETCFGVIICKTEYHRDLLRGYVGMLVVLKQYRGLGVGSELVRKCIYQMKEDKADEVVLECEVTNKGGLALYQNLGFIRDKRLVRYYLSGNDAFRLKLLLPLHPERLKEIQAQEAQQKKMLETKSEPSEPPGFESTTNKGPNPEGQTSKDNLHQNASPNTKVSKDSNDSNDLIKEGKTVLDSPVNGDLVASKKEVSEPMQTKGLGSGLEKSKKSGKRRTKKK